MYFIIYAMPIAMCRQAGFTEDVARKKQRLGKAQVNGAVQVLAILKSMLVSSNVIAGLEQV